jgi:hypothetical protein
MAITVGIDLAKSVFQVHGVDGGVSFVSQRIGSKARIGGSSSREGAAAMVAFVKQAQSPRHSLCQPA